MLVLIISLRSFLRGSEKNNFLLRFPTMLEKINGNKQRNEAKMDILCLISAFM